MKRGSSKSGKNIRPVLLGPYFAKEVISLQIGLNLMLEERSYTSQDKSAKIT